ncbi:MAG: putative toxin-antitoxin system toxin component, PIN family [Verrucomicrobiales bacterium]
MKFVLDTNVLFAAFATHGVCAGLYEEALLGGRIVVSQFILDELSEKLSTKAKLDRAEVAEVLDAVSADAEVLEVLPLAAPVCRDADDDWILATAVTAQADALVTGDKDLLVLGRYQNIPILTPRDALTLFRSR